MVAIRAMSFTNPSFHLSFYLQTSQRYTWFQNASETVLDRDWSSRYGIQRMRFDGFPFASRGTVTEEGLRLLLCPGFYRLRSRYCWFPVRRKRIGGVPTAGSELGERSPLSESSYRQSSTTPSPLWLRRSRLAERGVWWTPCVPLCSIQLQAFNLRHSDSLN